MKNIIILLVIAMLVGCSPEVDTDKAKQEQTDISLTKVESILDPFMKQQTAQYNDLSAKFDALQEDYTNLQAQLMGAQTSGAGYRAELAGIKADNKNLNTEMANTKTSLQNAVNEQYRLTQQIEQYRQDIITQQKQITEQQESYDEVMAKLYEIDDKDNDTINKYAQAKRDIFYELWNDLREDW